MSVEFNHFLDDCADQIIELNELAVEAILKTFNDFANDGMLEPVILTPDVVVFSATTEPPDEHGDTFYQRGELPTGERGFFCSRSPILPIFCQDGLFWKAEDHWNDVGEGEADVDSTDTGAIVVYRPIDDIQIVRIHPYRPTPGGFTFDKDQLATKAQLIDLIQKTHMFWWNFKEFRRTRGCKPIPIKEGILRQMVKFDHVLLAAITRETQFQGWEIYAEDDPITAEHDKLGIISPWVHQRFNCSYTSEFSAEIALADPDQLTVEAWELTSKSEGSGGEVERPPAEIMLSVCMKESVGVDVFDIWELKTPFSIQFHMMMLAGPTAFETYKKDIPFRMEMDPQQTVQHLDESVF